jgi:hypothetical protein
MATKGRKDNKKLFNLPKVTNKCCTLWGLVLAQRLEKGYGPIWEANFANLQPLGGANV